MEPGKPVLTTHRCPVMNEGDVEKHNQDQLRRTETMKICTFWSLIREF